MALVAISVRVTVAILVCPGYKVQLTLDQVLAVNTFYRIETEAKQNKIKLC